MKKVIIAIIVLLFITPGVIAQNMPQGMKYQAVARDLSGDILANEKVLLKIKLQDNTNSQKPYYTETHSVITNQFGLFSLIIGKGNIENGTFSKIPWSSQDIWMTIDIKDNKKGDFSTISSSKLLAVPYAFHAATASKIDDGKNNLNNNGPGNTAGVPSQNWSLFGNSKTNPEKDKLGTTDSTDMVFVTNNKERLRITADGQLITGDGKFTIGGNLEVQGDSTLINKDLFVGRNVFLNINEEFDPMGETINYGDLTVFGKANLKKLVIKDDVPDEGQGGYLVTFENTNDDKGDGLLIKLGNRAVKSPEALKTLDSALGELVGEIESGERETVKNLFSGQSISFSYLTDKMTNLSDEEIEETALAVAASACALTAQVGKLLIEEINKVIGFTDRDILVAINGYDPVTCPECVCDACFNDAGDFLIPDDAITDITDPFRFIPEIPTGWLDELAKTCTELFGDKPLLAEKLIFTVEGTPLNEENTFIEFADVDDFHMGAIKAQSLGDWTEDYFNKVFLFEVVNSLRSPNKIKSFGDMKLLAIKTAKSYYEIGVEYSSGNGDYAEWLERQDINESISYGDIVAVKGGKITKDLTHAEQVMAVSHRPIVLGNMPSEEKLHLGNNIAFMGQIPVKIMGPVNTGDYIVGKGEIRGYGVAVSPENMTIEDFKLAVGRSWDANLENGPKMVNTVVGVHNGDYLTILKRYEAKFQESEARLYTVEAKIDMLSGLISHPSN
ncbi:hypothetical protein V8G56_12660 [Gaetbulibacter aquiaggeris]|uniref:Uncharacterized protein n=1 Tax=Gaetbulibacter aquiaggeris TaxID=1735373 RepID=A0ABW7MSI6_9FLAO